MRTNEHDKLIEVMIVEDSATIRMHLEAIIGNDPRLHVVASAGSGEEALRLLERHSPDVISLDIRLPGMNGFEFTRRIMNDKPTPIVVCSASVESHELRITMNALRAGALAVVEKPVGETHADYAQLSDRLCNQLVIMSSVKVIRQRALLQDREQVARPSCPTAPDPFAAASLIGMVASTGGPNALAVILGSLPLDFPIPIVVVQHIAPTFADGFIDWLGTVCALNVVKASTGMRPEPGQVYVAPGDLHVRVHETYLETWEGPPECQQRPSGNVLFASMARALRGEAIGVLLTGMGEDGAEGLLALRKAGGYTIAEDRSTAVVYGMPGAAERLHAACDFIPLHDIGSRLVQRVAMQQEVGI